MHVYLAPSERAVAELEVRDASRAPSERAVAELQVRDASRPAIYYSNQGTTPY